MAMNTKHEHEEIVSDINMTPLIDVMLVLLIIFMVTSSAAIEAGLSVNLPESKSTSSTPESSLVITLTKLGEMSVGGQIVTMENLKEAIRKGLADQKTSSVVLEGDGSSTLNSAMDVMNMAREAGAKDFSIAAKLKEK